MNMRLFTHWKESHPSTGKTEDTLDKWIYGTLAVVGIPLAVWGLWAVGSRLLPSLQ